MSMSPDDQSNPTADGDAGISSSASASGSGGSSSAGSSSGSTSGSGGSAPRSSSDSRRVAPKWLGKKIGRFRLQGLLGQGAVGRVFRAEDAILHRRVALKVITIHSGDGQINRNADQFLTEARAAAALEHPNVVQIYEAGETGNLCYIAMELLDGGNLKDLVVAGGPMDPGRACLLTADAADALAAGHEAGIIHRDIKPANLMLSRQGRCKVTDFGLATFGDADSVSREKAAGTPLFAAPEVIRGTSADERSDIYSLGATLFYLLAGRPPFTAKTRDEVLRKHVNDPVPDLRQIRPGLPESLVAAVERSLDKDPGQRFHSATQFARVLRVQTIPMGAMPAVPPPMVAGDTISGASVLGLSGLTAVAGSTGGVAGGSGGRLTADDVASATRPAGRRAAVPPAVDYSSPAAEAAPAPFWRRPGGLAVLGGIGGVCVLALAALLLTTRRSTAPAVVPMPATNAPPVLPATPTPVPPPPVTPLPTATPPAATPKPSPGTVTLTRAESTPLPTIDLAQLTAIAGGRDADRPNKFATVVGTVHVARLSATGLTVRLEFDDPKGFAVVYFQRDGLYGPMAKKFGGTDGTALAGKTIRVTGEVRMYSPANNVARAPEIVIKSPTSVTVIDPPATP